MDISLDITEEDRKHFMQVLNKLQKFCDKYYDKHKTCAECPIDVGGGQQCLLCHYKELYDIVME